MVPAKGLRSIVTTAAASGTVRRESSSGRPCSSVGSFRANPELPAFGAMKRPVWKPPHWTARPCGRGACSGPVRRMVVTVAVLSLIWWGESGDTLR
jgi:hypothetical protein